MCSWTATGWWMSRRCRSSTPTPTVIDVTGLVVGPGLRRPAQPRALDRGAAPAGLRRRDDQPRPRSRAHAHRAGVRACRGRGARAELRLLGIVDGGAGSGARGRRTDRGASTRRMGLLGDLDWQRSSSPAELTAWLGLLEGELAAGALGIGVLMGYAPQSDPAEYLAVARLAAAAGTPTYTHVRELIEVDPTTPADGSMEVVRAAAETGAAMHHCHVNSTSKRHIDRVLATLDGARAAGSRVTRRGLPVWDGQHERRRILPGAGAAWRRRADALEHRHARHERAHRRRAAAARSARRPTPQRRASWSSSTSATRPTATGCIGRSPIPTRSWRATPCRSSGRTTGSTRGSGRCPQAPRRTRARRARSRGACGRWCASTATVGLGRGLPPLLVPAVARPRRHGPRDATARGTSQPGPTRTSSSWIRRRSPTTPRTTDPVRPSSGVRHLLVGGTFVIRDGELDLGAYPGRPVRGEPR